jgi:Holliday junction resolvase-like predicted endonuclease
MPTPRAKLGDWGEEKAFGFLGAYGEVDIVATEGDELVFVEVKTRRSGNFGTPEESVSPQKLRRLMATCEDYLQKSGQEDRQWRVDLISIRLEKGLSNNPKVERIDHITHVLEL